MNERMLYKCISVLVYSCMSYIRLLYFWKAHQDILVVIQCRVNRSTWWSTSQHFLYEYQNTDTFIILFTGHNNKLNVCNGIVPSKALLYIRSKCLTPLPFPFKDFEQTYGLFSSYVKPDYAAYTVMHPWAIDSCLCATESSKTTWPCSQEFTHTFLLNSARKHSYPRWEIFQFWRS